MTEIVDIILPVYRDLVATQRAIESVLLSQNKQAWHLIVINDASPDADMPALLESLCNSNDAITLLTNEENLGFVGTVNRGMALHHDRDVVLLNSDAVVANNWLDRMMAHAADDVASITPFSNNATICSTPRIDAENPDLNDPMRDTAMLDALHARTNAGASVEIPTGVGFCMWMSRKVMQELGTFDEETFGKGYGEEVDWCQRALKHGYKNLLACDIFAYHEGGVSFSEQSQARKDNAQRIIRKRYPAFEPSVSDWVQRDPALPYRMAGVAERYRSSGLPVIVHISHSLGGGTEKHIRELTEHIPQAQHLWLFPDPAGGMRLKSFASSDGVNLLFSLSEGMVALQDVLQAFGVTRFHVHSIIGFDENLLKQFLHQSGLPFDVTIHDYYFICPQIFLIDEDGRYCGEPDTDTCNRCIANRPRYNAKDINVWRASHSWWFEHAARVLVPSMDVAARLKRYHPTASFAVMPHPETQPETVPSCPPLAPDEPLRIAVIGALSIHKGSLQLIALMHAAGKAGLNLDIQHFGMIGERTPPKRSGSVRFTSHGLYEEGALASLLKEANPHLIWFPTNCPETYSYTLTQAFAYGAPLLTPTIGAFPERTAGRAWSFSYAHDASPEALAEQLAAIREHLLSNEPPALSTAPFAVSPAPLLVAQQDYLSPACPPTPPEDAADTRMQVGWIVSHFSAPDRHEITRISQPLTHPAIAQHVHLRALNLHEALTSDLDAIILSRSALGSAYASGALLAHCKAQGIALLYDLDDDLPNLDASHRQHHHYQQALEGMKYLAAHADRVIAATPALANALTPQRGGGHRAPIILPTYCDERLWPLADGETIAERQATAPLRVLYCGSPAHQGDFNAIAATIRPVLRKYRATLTVIGLDHPPSWAAHLEPPKEAAANHAQWVRWLSDLQREQPWHIGLAPLQDTAFNRCKSGHEFLDYSALGLAGIYAELAPFQDIIRHDVNGLLVAPNDPQGWASALETLLMNHEMRASMAQKAMQTLQARHTLSTDADLWAPVWLKALSSKETPAKAGSSAALPAVHRCIERLLETSPKRHNLKRLIKGIIHRSAGIGLARFCWRNAPAPLKKIIRRRVHQHLTG